MPTGRLASRQAYLHRDQGSRRDRQWPQNGDEVVHQPPATRALSEQRPRRELEDHQNRSEVGLLTASSAAVWHPSHHSNRVVLDQSTGWQGAMGSRLPSHALIRYCHICPSPRLLASTATLACRGIGSGPHLHVQDPIRVRSSLSRGRLSWPCHKIEQHEELTQSPLTVGLCRRRVAGRGHHCTCTMCQESVCLPSDVTLD